MVVNVTAGCAHRQNADIYFKNEKKDRTADKKRT